MHAVFRRTLLLGVLLLTTSCDEDLVGVVTDAPSVSLDELHTAPLAVSIGPHILVGEADASRNFEPGAERNRLVVYVRVLRDDGSDPTTPLEIERLWVLRGSLAWETSHLETRSGTTTGNEVRATARHGPNWPTGTNVVIVVQIRDVSGSRILLRIPDVRILRLE